MTDLLQHALEGHGGMDRWHRIGQVEARVILTGFMWKAKGHPLGLPNVLMRAATRQPALSIAPFHAAATTGFFTTDRVWIEDADGRLVEELRDPRVSFAGHVWQTPWTDLQELYFAGYAFWNYFNAPFFLTWPGVQTEEIAPHVEHGETWRRLRVTFPPDIPTHCAEQIFYFSDAGLLRRLDYVTEIAGGTAAHYCYDPVTVDGIVVPTLRRVVPRTPTGPIADRTAVLVQVSDVVLTPRR